MSAFEFVFTLFGLLLGLSLAEVLSKFSQALQMRRTREIGWLTPLLGIVVMLDIASFWSAAWLIRGSIKAEYAYLLGGLIVTGVYFLAASIVFPRHGESEIDYDRHYFEHRRQVFGALLFCNVAAFAGVIAVLSADSYWLELCIFVPYCVALLVAIVSADRRVNIAMLLALTALDLVAAIFSIMMPAPTAI